MSLFVRDRLSLFWALLFPIMLIVILGFAFGNGATLQGGAYAAWLVGGVVGTNLMGMALFNIGTSLLQYRERGMFARLLVAGVPIERPLIGLVLNRYAIIALQLFLMLWTAHALLGMKLDFQGASFFTALTLGIACFTFLGLSFALVVRTANAALALSNALYLPLAFLSGAYFSIDRLPGSAWLHLLPSSAVVDALRLSLHEHVSVVITSRPVLLTIAWTLCFGLVAFALRTRLLTEGR